jgi:hypothetical protein
MTDSNTKCQIIVYRALQDEMDLIVGIKLSIAVLAESTAGAPEFCMELALRNTVGILI